MYIVNKYYLMLIKTSENSLQAKARTRELRNQTTLSQLGSNSLTAL